MGRILAFSLCLWFVVAGACAAQERRFGLIEIGGSGVKATVVDIVASSDNQDVMMRTVHDYAPANLNPIFANNADAIAQSVAGFVDDIRSRYGLAPLRIYVLGSSGLESAEHAEALRAVVDGAVAGRAGALAYVSAEEQARLGFDGVVNCETLAHRRREVVFLDIGSSDLVGAAASGGGGCGAETIETADFGIGVKTLARAAGGVVYEQRAALVEAPLAEALARAPDALLARNRVYLGGGIVWALATFAHPEDSRRFVALAATDIEAFRAQLADDPLCVTDPAMAQRRDADCRFMDIDFSAVEDVEQRVRVSADHREIVTSIYTLDQLRAGAELLNVLREQMALERKSVFFARSALRAWVLGFLLREEAGVR